MSKRNAGVQLRTTFQNLRGAFPHARSHWTQSRVTQALARTLVSVCTAELRCPELEAFFFVTISLPSDGPRTHFDAQVSRCDSPNGLSVVASISSGTQAVCAAWRGRMADASSGASHGPPATPLPEQLYAPRDEPSVRVQMGPDVRRLGARCVTSRPFSKHQI